MTKRLIGVVVLLALLFPAAANAQQTGSTVEGSLLQSGGGSLQQAPAGLQGSTPQIFGGGGTTGVLDQSNKKLLTDLGVSAISDQKQEKVTSPLQPEKSSKTFLITLCLGLAGVAFALWLWLRRLQEEA